MNVTHRTDKDILYIAVEGRIDASNAAEAEEKIFGIKHANPGKHTVLDADELEYISSAGLRVILKIRKEEPKLAIINVASDVNTIKVALRTGILKTAIPLVSSFLDIFCNQYSYIDDMNAEAWRRVWEIFVKNIQSKEKIL